MTIERPPRNKQ